MKVMGDVWFHVIVEKWVEDTPSVRIGAVNRTVCQKAENKGENVK